MPSLTLQLEQAREHVKHAQHRIEEQSILIERLDADGHDTDAAERLMAAFIDHMAKLTMHRNRLEREAEERAKSAIPKEP